MKRKLLLLIDCQNDFIEGGNLPVEGGKRALDNIVAYIGEHHEEYDSIILTADWHLPSHCSFKENDGEWPMHCVQYSHGAAIYQPLLDVLNDVEADYQVLTKGCDEDHEEYSVFKNVISREYLSIVSKHTDEVDVAGLALDFCVAQSIRDARKTFVGKPIRLLADCTASIGNRDEVLSEVNKIVDEVV